MKNSLLFLTTIAGATFVAGLSGCATNSSAAPTTPEQSVSILMPADNATVTSPFMIKFGVKGMTVLPAGDIVANTGHHHLLINLDPTPAGESIPFTEKHIHFGKGQTEAEVKLEPGKYKLTAQFANGAHQSYGKAMSQTITLTVK